MKKFFLICALGLLAFNTNACLINIAYNIVALPPYYVGDGEGIPQNPGAAVELVDLAAASLGCQVHWLRMPAKRAQRDLEQSAIDAMLALSYSKDRAGHAVYPMKNGAPDSGLAVWTLSYDFYVRSGSSLVWDGKQFNRKPDGVGANAGYSVVKDLVRLGIPVEEAPGDQNNLVKLVRNRIEAFAGQDLVVDQLREQAEFKGIDKLAPSIVRNDYFLAFSKAYFAGSGEVANRLWKQIAEFKKSHGKALLAKYRLN